MRRALVLLAIAIPPVGCAALIGADFDAHLESVQIDGAIDAGAPSDAQTASDGRLVCMPAEVPPNAAQGKGLGGAIDFWTAIYTINYGDGNGDPDAATYEDIGYDIDHVCTGLGDTPTCKQGSAAAKDGVGGRDDATGNFLFQLKHTVPFFATDIGSASDTADLQSGDFGILFHVSGYNGQADDDQVTLDYYAAAAFYRDKADGAPPAWNGSDEWPLRSDSVQLLADGGFGPLASDVNAYVAGGTVVASLPHDAHIASQGIDFKLSGVFITATVTQTPQGYVLQNGVLAGTWNNNAIFAGITPFFDKHCSVSYPFYGQIKMSLCDALDVSGSGVPLPTAPCDALSLGVAFTTMKCAPPGAVVDASISENGCDAGLGFDPSTDTCFPDGG